MRSENEEYVQMSMKVVDENDNDDRNGESSAQKCFAIIPSLFRKRSNKYKMSPVPGSSSSDDSCHSPSIPELDCSTLHIFPITNSCLPPGSPISPRVKNFNSDMRELAASRTDNPYISEQLDRTSTISSVNHNSDNISTILIASPSSTVLPVDPSSSSLSLLIPNTTDSFCVSPTNNDSTMTTVTVHSHRIHPASPHHRNDSFFTRTITTQFTDRSFNAAATTNKHHKTPSLQRPGEFFDDFQPADEPNLHDKLVRSPPPHFPEKISQLFYRDSSFLNEIVSGEETITVTEREA